MSSVNVCGSVGSADLALRVTGSDWRARRRLVLAFLAACVVACLGMSSDAWAASGPAWRIDAMTNPTAMPGEQVGIAIEYANIGDASLPAAPAGDSSNCTVGAPAPPAVPGNCYRIIASFPSEITPISTQDPRGATGCVIDGGTNTVTCEIPAESGSGLLVPHDGTGMLINVEVGFGAVAGRTLTSTFEVSGGGGGSDTTVEVLRVTSEPPEFGVAKFDGQVNADAAGSAMTQAAGRPYDASTSIEFNSFTNPVLQTLMDFGALWPVEPPKTVVVDLPPGFVGNPTIVDQCTLPELANTAEGGVDTASLCPVTSQVGVTTVRASNGAFSLYGPVPVYSMVPPPNVPASFGFNVQGTVVLLDAEVRSESDYGVTVTARNIAQGLGIQGTSLTLWGVPSDASHDLERGCPGQFQPANLGPTCPSGAPARAFLRNPTMCTESVGLVASLRTDSWDDPGDFKPASFVSHLPPAYPAAPEDWGVEQGTTDCDRVPFKPTLRGDPPAGAQAGKPSGFSFDLSLPQGDDPRVPGSSDLRKAVVTLPQGVRVSPSAANELAACSSAQIALDSRDAPTCPTASRVGSLTIETPLLREPLEGSVFLATPFDNPFNSLIAIYIVARGPGVVVKLPGHVTPDASKGGQLTATFDDQPQVPFSNLHLEFESGPRAPIVLPKQCGTYTTHSVMTGWNGRVVESDSSFTVSEGCTGGFNPRLHAGTKNPVAGAASPFVLRLTREDSDEELRSLSIDTPRGLTGRISDVELCGELDARNGTCRESSRVGSVTVGAGAGTNPFYITSGRAYLTDSYRGCDFGLSIVVPAVAGPFDLGIVVVRSSVCVDKHTAELRVTSDELPTQLQGIPLDVRDVRVNVDRPGFFLNPTGCEEKTIRGVIQSTAGSSANVSQRFEVGECAALPFRPRMSITVGGRGATQRGRTTPLSTTLRQTPGQAGLDRVRVTLPMTINARLTVINDACTRAEFEAGRCEDARTGSATARTPLLRDPLRGGVYFVRNGNPLPDLFVALRGQVDFDLIGRITIPGSKRLRTTFNTAPDVPVTSFTLRLNGGRRGSVGNAANLCSRRGRNARAELSFTGQNGKQVNLRPRLRIRGCSARRSRRTRRRGRR